MRSARIKLPGHPDSVCDMVAEALVDEYLRRDPASRVAVSVNGGHGALFISGDVASAADFDAAAIVRRTLGSLGVMEEVEPFVSLEAVVAEQLPSFASGAELPVTAVGYATSETPELVPSTIVQATRIAKALDERRRQDAEWFWLGPDAEVVVMDGGQRVESQKSKVESRNEVWVFVEHGVKPLTEARAAIASVVQLIAPGAHVRVNELGTHEARGLAHRCGSSNRSSESYGSYLPAASRGIGKDIHHPEKAGAWLARAAARGLVSRGANAALIHATYLPGERTPARIVARDERGKNLSSEITPSSMSLDRVARDWWRAGLNADAARWGLTGEAGLPWEATL